MNVRLMNWSLVCTLVTATGIAGSPATRRWVHTDARGHTVPHSLPFTRLHNGINSGYTKHSEFVIQDPDEFTRRWRGVLQGSPDAEKPTVHFDSTTVVFVAIGSRNTGGYSVRVDSVTDVAGGAMVHYTVSSPGARCMSLQELTSPVEVISFDRVAGPVRFSKRNVKGAC